MPFTDEQAALIADAFSEHSDDGTYYAAAAQYIDALAEYISLLNTRLNYSPTDAIEFVMSKYGGLITESENTNLAVFVQMQLEKLGG